MTGILGSHQPMRGQDHVLSTNQRAGYERNSWQDQETVGLETGHNPGVTTRVKYDRPLGYY